MTEPNYSASTIDRKTFLGASEIAAVLGLSPWKSPLEVWSEKRGIASQPGNQAMRVGQVLERPILEHLYEAQGELIFPGTLLHTSVPWAGCTPDAFEYQTPPPDGKGARIDVREPAKLVSVLDLQVKVVGYGQARRWGQPEEGEIAVPQEVRIQVQWELEVTDLGRARILALIGTDFRVYEIARDKQMGEDLLTAAEPFWMENVQKGVMPPVDGSESSRRVLERHFGLEKQGMAAASAEAIAWANRYKTATETLKLLEAEKEEAGNQLRLLIADKVGLEWSGGRATWKSQSGRIHYADACKDLLQLEQLEPYRGDPIRVLRISLKEE